ncbi:hypothetical protein ARMSODRAFT_951396 [Armillaria solidipes]|uniref:DUF6534 domain-containing protein n=1 Tax=Armillaria solidipes TaxID=1076256 RepID=A0A2H3CF14_9AGAR|nr:hypothetical protein ARMSODRAFT_951396 [Armillaria solidipes]
MLPIPAGYPIERLSGPQIVGYLLNWGLFGTLSVQLYLYYLAFPKDRRSVKYLVYGIYIVEFVQTMLVTHDAFASFGYGFGDLEALTEVQFSWLVIPIMGAIAASVGQGFYTYRIFILSRSRIVPAFIICVSLTSSVAAIIAGVYIFQAGDLTKLNDRKTSISLGISGGGYALCDIVIAICMTYYLMRSNTGFRRTRILVTKLICLTIETGSVTAVVALAIPILFFAFPHQNFYVTPALVISKLYVNAIYMVLNSRIQIMGGRDTYTSSTDMEITTTMMRDITSHSTQGAQRTPVVAITKEVFSSSDDEMGRMSEKPLDDDMSLLA